GTTSITTITNSIISQNTAQPAVGPCGVGGGIWAQGTVLLSGCTVSNNLAQLLGGGIFNFGALTITSCTVSGNRAESKHTPPFPPKGGGIDNDSGALLEISNSTISGN